MQRREFLKTTGVAAAGATLLTGASAHSAPIVKKKGKFTPKVVASGNGMEAVRIAYEKITSGEDVLDAVIAGVNVVEDDPEDITVGYGGLPNENGIVELDSAVMHGPSHRAGAVASLRNIKNPSKVAKLVMEQTDHVLLVGEGALQFARANGFPEENLLTEKARNIWLYWKQSLSDDDDWLTPPDEELEPYVRDFFGRPTGTIHCGGIDAKGNVSCVTTTSGLFFKMPGRVGDSPIIGAGLYCDNEVGTCGSTGRGEANLQNLCSFAGVELMRQGMSPVDAGLEVLRRVAHTTREKHLLQEDGRPNFGLKFYLIGPNGDHAGVSMWGPSDFAICDDNGPHKEDCACLFER